jgi:hypothetical protein
MNITLYIPRWFYPYNLGDSFHSFFAPKVIKEYHKNSHLTVVTYGELINLMKLNPYVDCVREPLQNEIGSYSAWKNYAFLKKDNNCVNYCLFAEWHPNLWNYWNSNFDFFVNHPSANILTVNSLLQLGMESLLFENFDLHTLLELQDVKKEQKTLGIVPATKLAGRPEPHPGCDGIGLRFNGDNGESWVSFVNKIKKLDPTIHIVEYSKENFGFGDEHIPHKDWLSLAKECHRPKVAVMSDGGMHHVFNSQGTSVVLLGAQRINKPCFFKMSNAKYYEDLHSKCTDRCYNTIRKLTGWTDLKKTCDNSCQKVDSILLADKIYEDYFK